MYEPRDDPNVNDQRYHEEIDARRQRKRDTVRAKWKEIGEHPDDGLYDAYDVDPDIGDR